ncbi:MAG: hypothetical protein STHCBS139747_001210 [Sporothrix thermara]
MEASKAKGARPPQARNNSNNNSNNSRAKVQTDSSSTSSSSSSSSSSFEEAAPRRSTDSSSSSEESTSNEASSSVSESMPPPRQPNGLSTPPGSVIASASASASVSRSQQGDEILTRPSRSESTASRANRLSLTLPIALPTSFPSRPMPASATVASFPATPVDIASGLASPAEPVDLITAIAAQERRVLELREELNRTERVLAKLKKQWASHEVRKNNAELRKMEPMRSMSTRSRTSNPAGSWHSPAASMDETSSRHSEVDKKKALLLGHQGSSQPASDPNTPTQSRRRVFRGGHARTLSLLSPTKTSHSEGFAVHEDQTADAEQDLTKSSLPLSPLDLDSAFLQNLGRYAPAAASQLSKRASWAPQSVQQVAGAGLKQVAGDLTATLWTFVEDLRQATVGEELGGTSGSMRTIDPNSRAAADDMQSTIRASANSRPTLSRAFTTDLQGTPAPAPRTSAAAAKSSDQQTETKAKTAKAASGNSSNSSSSKTRTPRTSLKTTKEAKRFSLTPLTVDALDDSDWSSWDTPTVNTTKSPRWSGSTVNSELIDTSIPEQADENSAPQKQDSDASPFSPTSPSGSKTNDISWPAALNRLTPGNIKRTATDLMKEWEKSLSPPGENASMSADHVVVAEDRLF